MFDICDLGPGEAPTNPTNPRLLKIKRMMMATVFADLKVDDKCNF